MDTLTISLKTSTQLSKVNSLVKESDGSSRLKNMCKYILQIVMTGKPSVCVDPKDEEILTAISIVIFEAARVQANEEQLKSALNEINLDTNAIDLLAALYDGHKDSFVQHLNVIGIAMPEIVDIEWRLDYVVRSKHGGRENYPLFLISLKVKDRGLVRNIDFTATQEELQDMLSKVRDGVKQVDRILNTKEGK